MPKLDMMSESDTPADWGVWFSTAHSTRIPAHCHEGTEFNVLTAGRIRYEADGMQLDVMAGQMIVLPAGGMHELTWVSEEAALWVLESPVPFADPPDHEACVIALHQDWLADFCRLARKLWLRPSAQQKQSLQRGVGELLKEPRQGNGSGPSRISHEAVLRARSLCDQHLDSDLDIADLARQSGISASRLAHLFQEQVGITPVQYKNFVRIQHFIRRYEEGRESLLQAALRSGFGSYPQFHRVFRQVCGAGPHAHLSRFFEREGLDPKRTLGSVPWSA